MDGDQWQCKSRTILRGLKFHPGLGLCCFAMLIIRTRRRRVKTATKRLLLRSTDFCPVRSPSPFSAVQPSSRQHSSREAFINHHMDKEAKRYPISLRNSFRGREGGRKINTRPVCPERLAHKRHLKNVGNRFDANRIWGQ